MVVVIEPTVSREGKERAGLDASRNFKPRPTPRSALVAVAASAESGSEESRCLQQFANAPDVIADASGHCGCATKRAVNSAEVVKREPDHQRRAVVLERFTEGIRESSESANAHADRKILSLDMRCADALGIGIADAWDHLRTHHLRRAVAPFAFRRRAVDLDELREVRAILQRVADRGAVRSEAVSGDLKPTRGCHPQAFDKNVRGALVAATDGNIQDQLGVRLHRDEGVAIAKRGIVARATAFFFLADERPNLVSLNIADGNPHQRFSENMLALLASDQLQDRRVVNARHQRSKRSHLRAAWRARIRLSRSAGTCLRARLRAAR
jgi:hypothetical protein